MPHLLSLPAEVRNRIYDLYLDDLQLEIGRDADSGEYVRFARPGWSHATSLTLVNRQLHRELGDRKRLCTSLLMRGRLHDRRHLDSYLPQGVLQQIQHLHTKISGTAIQDIGCLSVRDLPSLRHISWSPSTTTGLSISDLLGDQVSSMAHTKCWTDKTATEVVQLVGVAHADGLDAVLRGTLLRWESSYEHSLLKRMRKYNPAFRSLEILVGIAPLWADGWATWNSCMWNGHVWLEKGQEPIITITKTVRLVKMLRDEAQGLKSWPGAFCECSECDARYT